jgi:3-oxoacyl-[acyl-carrier protein] reductase
LACIPLGKAGNPRDVGNLTLFLATELSDYMTGELIRLDGSALS